MSQPPPGYTIRAAEGDDAGAVGEVLAAADRAEHGDTTLGEGFVRSEWDRPRFDLASDTAVVSTLDGSVVAYGEAFDEATPDVVEGMGVVHPRHCGRGLGALLIRAQERRAREQLGRVGAKRVTLHTVISGRDREAARLVAVHGFRPVRTFFHMEAELVPGEEPPVPPPGIEVRRFEAERDEQALYRVLEDAFRGHWGRAEQPFEEWRQAQVAAGSDPELCFLATRDDEVVGAITIAEAEGHGWVNELGVLEAHRGRGIGAFLLRQAFAALARKGQSRVLLNVDAENATGAVGVYERAGMHVRRRWDVHGKEVGWTTS